ncbi:ABC transporter ATP-binding protein [Zwartia vadi]|uniref:cyanophycin metabolism-associated ABC transporter n=1 Tax=Zwartia vadi TaxID=3058168 RepID=UPI003F498756
MTTLSASELTLGPTMPTSWSGELTALLEPDEHVLAWLEPDLDEQLFFASGALVLSSNRLFSRAPGSADWLVWTVSTTQSLQHRDHAGVGAIELFDGTTRLGIWRHTLGIVPAVARMVELFGNLQKKLRDPDAEITVDAASCPACGTPFAPDQDECAVCDAAPTGPSDTWALLRLARFAKPYRLPLLVGLLLTLMSTAASLVPPYLTMPLMDDILIPFQNGKPIDYDLVTLYLTGLVVAALLAWLLGWARTYLLSWVSERIGADLRTTTFNHLQTLSLQFFGGKRTGDLMARIGSETDRINLFLSLHFLDFVNDVLMILMTAAILLSIDPWLAVTTLVPLPIIIWMIHMVRDRLRFGFEKVDRSWSELTNVLADTIPGIRVVKAFAQEKREVARFREANDRYLSVNDRINKIWALFAPTVTFLTEIGLLVVWIFGITQVASSAISVGVLAAFLAYIGRFYTRLDSMSRIVTYTQQAAAGAKRIFDILDHVSSVPDAQRPVPLERMEGRIEIRNVGFRYGSRTVLRNVNLNIGAGEMIGLVGHSGSGKSSLVNLICRFYDVTEGGIRVDGVDIRSYSLNSFRSNIGLVLQEPFLFFGTIAENIAYGKPGASREEVIAAARAARAHEFILRLPQGYDSLVGERGQALSGGERQRISIARALLIDPRILILDEATSSVDTTTEMEIQEALDNLIQGRTTIAIAHRLSTLRKADRLVVLDRGQVVEIGNHEDLLARGGAYHALYEAQTRQLDAEPPLPSSSEANNG